MGEWKDFFCEQSMLLINAKNPMSDMDDEKKASIVYALPFPKKAEDMPENYDVAVYFENSYFPMKSYGDVTFPPGEYEAFRIDIGAHDGKKLVVRVIPAALLCGYVLRRASGYLKRYFKEYFDRR
mgnify:CR=1 FL=1